MGSKQWMQPAPTYHPLQTFWDTEDDAPGPRCTHTLTAIAPTKTHGPASSYSMAPPLLAADLPQSPESG
ncbi:putative protein-serine/threonine phosphatase [Helianthus anomalus]